MSEAIPGNRETFKNDENGFYFAFKHVKRYFTLKAIFIFGLAYLVILENWLIIKIRLISKFMTSQLG